MSLLPSRLLMEVVAKVLYVAGCGLIAASLWHEVMGARTNSIQPSAQPAAVPKRSDGLPIPYLPGEVLDVSGLPTGSAKRIVALVLDRNWRYNRMLWIG